MASFLIIHGNTVYRSKMWRKFDGTKIWIPPKPNSFAMAKMSSMRNLVCTPSFRFFLSTGRPWSVKLRRDVKALSVISAIVCLIYELWHPLSQKRSFVFQTCLLTVSKRIPTLTTLSGLPSAGFRSGFFPY